MSVSPRHCISGGTGLSRAPRWISGNLINNQTSVEVVLNLRVCGKPEEQSRTLMFGVLAQGMLDCSGPFLPWRPSLGMKLVEVSRPARSLRTSAIIPPATAFDAVKV